MTGTIYVISKEAVPNTCVVTLLGVPFSPFPKNTHNGIYFFTAAAQNQHYYQTVNYNSRFLSVSVSASSDPHIIYLKLGCFVSVYIVLQLYRCSVM